MESLECDESKEEGPLEFTDLDDVFSSSEIQIKDGKLTKKEKSEQKARDYWLTRRQKVRLKTKEKKKEERERREKEGENFIPDEKLQRAKLKKKKGIKWNEMKLEDIKFNLPRVVIDLSFQHTMDVKELKSVSSQIMRCYGVHKMTERPLYFYITSCTGQMKTQLEKHDNFHSWKIFTHEEPFTEVFPLEEIVYLTPESPNVMHEIDKEKVYIIGGISDNGNALKGLTYRFAVENGIETARLPIQEHLPDVTRCLLNVNHVKVAEDGDWKGALLQNVPQRFVATKQHKEKDTQPTTANNEELENENP